VEHVREVDLGRAQASAGHSTAARMAIFKLKAVKDVLEGRIVKRNVPLKTA
jgi:hypothetical protein